MPSVIAIGLGRPQGYYSQDHVFKALGHRQLWWPIFESAGISGRPLYLPPEIFVAQTPQEQQHSYAEAVMVLSKMAIREALELGKASAAEISCFSFSSCTGVPLCPSFPSVIGGDLGLPGDCLFLPLHGVGCQGSGPGLRAAWDHLRLNPLRKALVVATEISHSAYHPKTHDEGRPNKGVFIGNSIFGDGAGCALLDGMSSRGLSLLDFAHWTDFSHKADIGMEWVEGRYRLVLSPDTPNLVAPLAKQTVAGLLRRSGLEPKDIAHVIVHSGGSAIIEQLQKAMKLEDAQVRIAWENWHDVGNLSSATVMFALRRLFDDDKLQNGDMVVLVTLGAGIECDAVLGVWC